MTHNSKLQCFPFLRLIIPLSLGIVLAEQMQGIYTLYIWSGVVLLMLVLGILTRKQPYLQSLFILLMVFAIGALRMSESSLLSITELPKDKVLLKGVLMIIPQRHGKLLHVDVLSTDDQLKGTIRVGFLSTKADKNLESLHIGSRIELLCRLKNYSLKDTTTFNYGRWLKQNNYIAAAFVLPHQWKLSVEQGKSLTRLDRLTLFFHQYKQRLIDNMSDKLGRNNLSIVVAMLLGERSLIPDNIRNDFSITGASHVLALSGLHLTVIYGIFMLLFARIETYVYKLKRLGFLHYMVLIIIWSYVLLVGMSPSVVRSATMLTFYTFVKLLCRDASSLNTLGFTVFLMLLVNPYQLYDIGFQLSFMAVLGILLFYDGIAQLIVPLAISRFWLVQWLWKMMSVSMAAQLLTAPLIAYHFKIFSSYFLLSSLVAVPLTTVILYLGVLLTLVGNDGVLCLFTSKILVITTNLLSTILHKMTLLPCSKIELGFTFSQIIIYYLLLWLVIWLIRFLKYRIAI